jgi:hypothetical protein
MAAKTRQQLLQTLVREWVVLRALVAAGWCLVRLILPTAGGLMLLIDRMSQVAWGIRALRMLLARGEVRVPIALDDSR